MLPTAPYLEQQARWPTTGRSILAHHDEDTIVVYQAYAHEIGRFAATNGWFGGGSAFVAEQREHARGGASDLLTPVERVFVPADPAAAARIGLDASSPGA